MNITTKYEVGQKLWFMSKNKPIVEIVREIIVRISSWSNKQMIDEDYLFAVASSSVDTRINKCFVFASKDELLKSL